MYMALAKFLIDRPIVTNTAALMLLIFGFLSGTQLRRLSYPNVDFKKIAITAMLPGASPQGMEKNVTARLEDAIRDVDGIDSYSSESSEGMARITVNIDPDASDPNKVKTDIRSAIDNVNDLPDEMETRPQTFEVKNENFSIYEVAFASKSNDTGALQRHLEALKNILKQIPEVTKIYEAGNREREIRIELDAAKLYQYRVSLNQVVNTIEVNKVRLGAGKVKTDAKEQSIITVSEFDDLDSLRQLAVRGSATGPGITIGQLGRVLDSYAEPETIVRYNGRVGQSLWIVKKGSADIIRTVDKIKAKVAAYQNSLGDDDIEIFSTWDQSTNTRNRLKIVTGNVALGFFLVVLVLFLFLDWRVAVWAALGIPLSLAVATLVMPLLDLSINTVSLCGMVVVLGMIVDDAIIIAEAIYRQIELGKPPSEAAYYGLQLVVKPVLGTILTTIVAFFPIYYIPGLIGSFSYEIPSIVIIMLAASFVEATLMLPCHLAHGRTRKVNAKPPLAHLMVTSREVYQKALLFCLRKRYPVTLGFIVVMLVTGFFASKILRFNMFPNDQAFRMWVRCELQEGTPLEASARAAIRIEQALEEYDDVIESTKLTTGSGRRMGATQSNAVSAFIVMTQATEREMTAEQLQEGILAKLRSDAFPELANVDSWIISGGPFLGRPIEIQVIGNDEDQRLAAVNEIKTVLPEFHMTEITDDNEPGKQQLLVEPDLPALARAGINTSAVALSVRTAFNGTVAGYRQENEDRIPYRVVLNEESQSYEDPLGRLLIDNPFGNLVPLKPLVKTTVTNPTSRIYHEDGQRLTTITGNVDLEKTTPKEVHEQLSKRLSEFSDKYPGIDIRAKGEGEESSRLVNRIYILLLGAVLGVYLILVVQFNSLTQPVMVLLGIPFGLIGVALGFGLQGLDVSLLAAVGIVGFCGVVVNDSLIMVDYINKLIEQDKDKSRAKFLVHVMEGAAVRFRPILLTTISTVAGLVPTAYGLIGGLDSFISPLVMAMMWGLLAGTPSILFIIPCLYAINHDAVGLVSRFSRRTA